MSRYAKLGNRFPYNPFERRLKPCKIYAKMLKKYTIILFLKGQKEALRYRSVDNLKRFQTDMLRIHGAKLSHYNIYDKKTGDFFQRVKFF